MPSRQDEPLCCLTPSEMMPSTIWRTKGGGGEPRCQTVPWTDGVGARGAATCLDDAADVGLHLGAELGRAAVQSVVGLDWAEREGRRSEVALDDTQRARRHAPLSMW